MIKRVINVLIIIFSFGMSACEPDLVDEAIIPGVFPTFTLNITSYPELMINGGAKDITNDPNCNGCGNRGIIVYRKNAATFVAFEATCSLQPSAVGSTVGIDQSQLFMIDVSCGSQFNFEGDPVGGGLAWRPLLQYQTSISGTQLTISSTVINY
jgi:hypothetical protein